MKRINKVFYTAVAFFFFSQALAAEVGLPSVVVLSDHIKNVVAVDLKLGMFSLFENKEGKLSLVKTMPISIGKKGYDKFFEGDKKTPIGIYKITGFKPDNTLESKYGIGAFPLDYPNTWDKRRARTGSGIWIHGMEKSLSSRPARDSDGCVVLNNQNLQTIFDELLDKNTPVILAENTPLQTFLSNSTGSEFVKVFNNWVSAWESQDVERYLDYYASDFNNEGKNIAQWAAHKRRVNKQKTFIDIDATKLSVFDYPNEENIRLVEFYQDYKSNNYSSAAWKRQFWKLTDGDWKILYEDTYW